MLHLLMFGQVTYTVGVIKKGCKFKTYPPNLCHSSSAIMGNKLALPVFCGNSNLCCCGKDAGNKRNRYRRRSSKNPANDTSRRESQLSLAEEEEDVDLLDGRPRSSSAYSLPPISILHTSQDDYATDFSHLHPLNSQNADQNPSFLQTITSKLKPSALAHPLADDETTSFLLSSSCDPTSLDTAEPLQPDHLSHVARIADMRAQQELLLKSGVVEGLTDDQLLQEEEEARMKEEAEINERRKRAEELAKKLGINNSLKLTVINNNLGID